MGKKEAGVEILLEPGTAIPDWIMQSRHVKVATREIRGRAIIAVRIRNGEASFADACSFIVRFPDSEKWPVAFQTPQVLQIRDFAGAVLKSNYYLCEQCFTNSGEFVEDKPSKYFGRFERMIRCSQCGLQWERTI